MKRFFLALLPLIFTVSCKSSVPNITAAQLIGNDFSCIISFSAADTDFSAEFIKSETLSLRLLSPETVKGFVFEKTGKTVTVSYSGIGLSIDAEKLPAASVGYSMFDYYLSDFDSFSVSLTDGGEICLSKSVSGVKVCTLFDKTTNVPICTFDEENNFKISYSDYKLL